GVAAAPHGVVLGGEQSVEGVRLRDAVVHATARRYYHSDVRLFRGVQDPLLHWVTLLVKSVELAERPAEGVRHHAVIRPELRQARLFLRQNEGVGLREPTAAPFPAE